MASPQPENGHVDIALELVDNLAKTYLSASESKIFWVIVRKTWGWHKKMDRISYTQFESLTGMNRRHIAPSLKRLISRHIVTQTGNGQKLQYGIQKDYDRWITITQTGNDRYNSLPEQVTIATITQTGNAPLPKQVMKPLPKQVNTKEKKETIKRNIYGEFKNILLSDEEYQKLVSRFTEPIAKKWIEIVSSGIASNPQKYKYANYYATILNWKRRDDGKKPQDKVGDDGWKV